MIRARSAASVVPGRVRWQASTVAQRTSRLSCLVIGPWCTMVSDSRCRGVSPAQQHSLSGRAKRRTSPISRRRSRRRSARPHQSAEPPDSRDARRTDSRSCRGRSRPQRHRHQSAPATCSPTADKPGPTTPPAATPCRRHRTGLAT